MTAAEFFQLAATRDAEWIAFVDALPLWVQIWMNVMSAVFLPSIVYMFRHIEAVVVFGVLFYNIVIGYFLVIATGAGPQTGLIHILIWPLILIVTAVNFKKIDWRSWYGRWLATVCAVVVISLIFDIRDMAIWLGGMEA